MRRFDQLDTRLDGIVDDMADLKKRVNNVETKLAVLPQVENRLQHVERHFWVARGVLFGCFIFWIFVQFALFYFSNFEIFIRPKP